MFVCNCIISTVFTFADTASQTEKGEVGLANFCARCRSGTVDYTPDENTNAHICQQRVRQRIFRKWRAENLDLLRKTRPNDLLRALESAARKTCKEEWGKVQCKEYCLDNRLPTKVRGNTTTLSF